MSAADRHPAQSGRFDRLRPIASSGAGWVLTVSLQPQTCYMERTMTEGADESLSERAQLLLKALIENYIRDGQPVGSRTLSRDSGLSLSSATIRNVMADLEDLGFVASPHTSAGRVPTDKGYRFFVDTPAQTQAPAARGGRGDRAAPGQRCRQRPLAGADRLADALERHAHGGPGDAAQPELRRAVADRVRRRCPRTARSRSWS